MPKISEYTSQPDPDPADLVPTVDVTAGDTKQSTWAQVAASDAFTSQFVVRPDTDGTAAQVLAITSLDPLVTEWADGGAATSTSGYADPLHRWRQAYYDDAATAKMVWLGDSTSDGAGNALSLYSNLDLLTQVGGPLAGMSTANVVDGGNNGATLSGWLSDAAGANSATYSWADLQADAPDLVVASWGINDVRQGATTLAQMIERIDALIALIQGTLTGTDILLRMPNSFTTTVVGTDYVNTITHQEATDLLREAYLYFQGRYANVDVIDLQSMVFGTTALASSVMMSDEIHPNTKGYARIAHRIAEHVGQVNALGPTDQFKVVGKVTQAGTNYFDITALSNTLSGDAGNRAVRWPISQSDVLVLSTYGRLSLSAASFQTTGGDVLRVALSGAWASLLNQMVSLSHDRLPGVSDGRHMLTIDPGNVAAGATLDVTATVTGVATTGNGVIVQPPTTILATGLLWMAMVSADNTITVRLHNPTGSDIDLASSGLWRAWVAY